MISKIEDAIFQYLTNFFKDYGIEIKFQYSPDLDLLAEYRRTPAFRVLHAEDFDKFMNDDLDEVNKFNCLQWKKYADFVEKRWDMGNKQIEAVPEVAEDSEDIEEYTVENQTAAKIKTGDINKFGIRELIGKGESSFSHSSEIRNHNVAKGAEIVNQILVAPGEEFSFIKNLGEVSSEVGFKKAYVIKQGKTELDVGGGICQVSTTLFRAALNAGLDITERKAHAYRVSYYEEDSKPGFDATVFIPKPDLRFINDTDNHILIQSRYDGNKKHLTYEIFGTNDGRK
jgi:vancomycin resistance protein YoaR